MIAMRAKEIKIDFNISFLTFLRQPGCPKIILGPLVLRFASEASKSLRALNSGRGASFFVANPLIKGSYRYQ